ncbi:hypothetical protein CHUAL_014224 [Chamberlinius hualienensis]
MFMMVGGQKFQQIPLFLICICYSSICKSVSLEMDSISDELKPIKSPYKAMKSIKKAIKRYENLRNLSKDANQSLSMPLFMFYLSSLLAPSLALYITVSIISRSADDIMSYVTIYDTVFNFLFCLEAFYYCTQANLKRGQLAAAIIAQMAKEQSIPLPHIILCLDNRDFVIDNVMTNEDWFNLAGCISIDEEFFLNLFQTVLGYYMTIEEMGKHYNFF